MEEYKQSKNEFVETESPEVQIDTTQKERTSTKEALEDLGIELFSDTSSVEFMNQLLSEKISDSDRIALERLESDGEEGVDFSSIVADLHYAEFSNTEIGEILDAHKGGNLGEMILHKIEEEKEYLAQKLDNPEFVEGVKKSVGHLKEFADSMGLTSLIQERWPRVMYTGKFGRMLLRSKEMGFLDPHALAAGEYVHEDKTARLHLVSEVGIPAGKKVLETQIHEMLHGISKNEIHQEGGVRVNVSGVGVLRFDSENQLESKNTLNNVNEGVTEYFARKFCSDSYTTEPREEHMYDVFAQNIGLIIQQICFRAKESKEDVERKFFEAYIRGDLSFISREVESVLGKFGLHILNSMSKRVSDFLYAQAVASLGGNPKEKISVDIDAIHGEGLNKEDFVKAYPFVKVIKYDIDPVTYEPVEVEV